MYNVKGGIHSDEPTEKYITNCAVSLSSAERFSLFQPILLVFQQLLLFCLAHQLCFLFRQLFSEKGLINSADRHS